MTNKPKIFGLGFQKTGTSSLGKIFDGLGYRTASYHEFRDMADNFQLTWPEVTERAIQIAKEIDAAKDTPWPLLYRELDKEFPGSKFIHITRQTDKWIESAVNDFRQYPNGIHQLIYGVPYPEGNEQIWIERYERHNEEVAAYFQGRTDDYLHLSLESGLTYDAVCDFLNEPRIGPGAPVANKRWQKNLKKIWWRIKRNI